MQPLAAVPQPGDAGPGAINMPPNHPNPPSASTPGPPTPGPPTPGPPTPGPPTPGPPTPGAPTPGAPTTRLSGNLPEENQGKRPGLRERLKLVLKIGRRCVSCDEEVKPSKLVSATCGHSYCRPCIRVMVKIALKNRSLFPIRCCAQEIPAQAVAPALGPQARRVYISRALEAATPPAERWYCPAANCRAWISPEFLEPRSKTQKCPYCQVVICSICRDLTHGDQQCTNDPGLGEILDLARQQHWQRCYRCHALVERNGGCFHITCPCGAEFCYLCGRAYSNCGCRRATGVQHEPLRQEEGGLDPAVVVTAMEQADLENAAEAGRTACQG
ncbi:E3 ubiquitin-protein ligase ARIH2 [Penicillium rolfsii]|nr:E3 ubiquitin-protein ligase ARIH2 [Penicillium rolfsii]